jgi:hypothetical protein
VNMHGKQRKRGRLGGQGPTSGVYANKSSKNDCRFRFFCYKLGRQALQTKGGFTLMRGTDV